MAYYDDDEAIADRFISEFPDLVALSEDTKTSIKNRLKELLTEAYDEGVSENENDELGDGDTTS